MSRRVRVTVVVVALLVGAVALLAAVVVLVDPAPSQAPPQAEPVATLQVATTSGAVEGTVQNGVRTWRGLPYAAPPTGELRWRAPQPPESWDGVRAASVYGDSCFQPDSYAYGTPDAELEPRGASSEDCLFLNVSRPDDASAGLPVVVFLHGGGFFSGSGSQPVFNSAAFVERGVVLVSVNYRLGRLGWFAHPALDGGVANYGLLDQVAALRWVRDNVAAFGGSADDVTVMGASAGAMSVNALMVAPDARGLFSRAIAESAPTDAAAQTLPEAREEGEEAFPDATADELRALPATALLSSTFNVLRGDALILDDVLPETASAGFAAGREAPVPYLAGTTSQEFSDAQLASIDTDVDAVRAGLGGTRHDELVAAYGGRASYDAHVLDDYLFTEPAYRLTREHAARAPSYRYVFDVLGEGSGHGTEVPYVLDAAGTDAQRADEIADYWVAFARGGEPQVDGLPTWPDAHGDAYLQLTDSGPAATVPANRAVPALRVLARVTQGVS